MSDHEFEKKVKQKMDELRFSPSDAVWSGVQRGIGQGRSKRRGWLWIPAMLVAFSVTGYFLINNNASDTSLLSNTELNKTELNNTEPNNTELNNTELNNKEQSKSAELNSQADAAKTPRQSSQAVDGAETKTAPAAGNAVKESAPATSPVGAGENGTTAAVDPVIPPSVAPGKGHQDPIDPAKNPAGSDHPVAKAGESPANGSKQERKPERGRPGGNVQPAVDDLANQGSAKKGLKNKSNPKTGKREVYQSGNKTIGTDKTIADNNVSNKIAGDRDVAGKRINDKNIGDVKAVDESDADKSNVDKNNDDKNIRDKSYKNIAQSQDSTMSTTNADRDLAIVNTDSGSTANAPVLIATDSSSLVQKDSTGTTTPAAATLATKKPASAKSWTWGVNASAGISKLSEGNLGDAFKSTHTADAALASPQASNNSFLFRPTALGIPPPKASVVKPGVQLSVGGFVKKQLSKRFAVSAGLQYSQYNNVIHIGYRVDSSQLVNNGAQVMNVSRYYRADESSRFSNKYHFIEIPLMLHTQLNRSQKVPLLWNLGASVGQLIGSNALLFDSGTGVYYKDRSKYRKTQFGMSTGFAVGIFSKSATPLWIGPSVRYNNSRLFNSDIKDEKHLFSASIDFRLFLNKK